MTRTGAADFGDVVPQQRDGCGPRALRSNMTFDRNFHCPQRQAVVVAEVFVLNEAGSLASIVSLPLSVWAVAAAIGAKAAVRSAVRRNNRLLLALDIDRAQSLVREQILSQRLTRARFQSLREVLASVQNNSMLSHLEREQIQNAVFVSQTVQKLDLKSRAWLNRVSDELAAIRRRLVEELMEQVNGH